MRLSEAVHGFLISRTADGYSQNTLNIYRHHLHQLAQYTGDPELGTISPDDITRFFAWLRAGYRPKRSGGSIAPLAPATVSNAWCAVRSFYNWAATTLQLTRPDHGVRQPRFKRPEIEPLSQDEIARLLTTAEWSREAQTNGRRPFRMRRPTGIRDQALTLLLLDTGLRVSECARLCVRDIDLKTGEVFVEAHGSGRKTKSRHVYVGRATQKAVWRYLAERSEKEPDAPLFTADGQPMNRNSIRLMLSRLGKRAGVPSVHPHRLRHTFAIQYLRNSGDVFTLQRLLGHATLEMVRNYVALADADAASAHRRASPVDGWRL